MRIFSGESFGVWIARKWKQTWTFNWIYSVTQRSRRWIISFVVELDIGKRQLQTEKRFCCRCRNNEKIIRNGSEAWRILSNLLPPDTRPLCNSNLPPTTSSLTRSQTLWFANNSWISRHDYPFHVWLLKRNESFSLPLRTCEMGRASREF